MKIEIDITDHINVESVKEKLNIELTSASITGRGTYREIEKARMHLHRAQGLYIALAQMEVISDNYAEDVSEDLTRIESKINDIQREKEQEAVARHMKGRQS